MSYLHRTKKVLFLASLLLAILACATSNTASTVADSPITATLSEITGSVNAKQPADGDFSAAQNGMVLNPGSELQTGDDGRARLDLSDGTILRAGPSSHYKLKSIENTDNGLTTQVELLTGKLWILLKTGSIEVETPSGVASVRGSYLSVDTNGNSIRITCLEGDCSLGNQSGTTKLVAGQSAIIKNIEEAPTVDRMSEEDFAEWLSVNPEARIIIPAVTATQSALVTPSPTPQPISSPSSFGPSEGQFPAGINPITGKRVADPTLLNIPAMMVSVSNFPPVARPQAGLSFASFVYEFTITEGQNRYLAVFHGDFPTVDIPPVGGCEVRSELFVKTDLMLGNFVWMDLNKDGRQDPNEKGLPGVCVNLYDENGTLLQQTTTDSNGYYAFNVAQGIYTIEVVAPANWGFSEPNIGDENADSDAGQTTGRIEALEVTADDSFRDVGLVPLAEAALAPNPDIKTPKPEIGPIRSGRIFYAGLGGMYQSSCLVYAFASSEVLAQIPSCANVVHEDAGGGSMMELERMLAVAKDNAQKTSNFDYANNLFSETPPEGGKPANSIKTFWAFLNQAGWTYDPSVGSYLRFTDTGEKDSAGILHPDVDRLTGRQLAFDNFIVLLADHEVVSPTIIDIQIGIGNKGPALLFRDGQVYNIRWTTFADSYTKTSGKRHPMAFVDENGDPVALKPGRTWVMMITPFSLIEEKAPGEWYIRYYRPEGEKSGG
jgi:hypothetical protein